MYYTFIKEKMDRRFRDMKNLVLHDVSQDSAYRYTGITTFENLVEVTGD